MKGNIYTQERCPICGGSFKHDENRSGLFCRNHPEIRASKDFVVRFGRDITKRFKTYLEAVRFLTGLRFKTDEGSFDPRDYKKDHPLGFETQVRKYLSIKEKSVSKNQFRNIKRDLEKAVNAWGQTNVKLLNYAEIEDFLIGQEVSEKTRANARSALNSFFKWMCKREGLKMPDLPVINFELGWRNIIDIELQQSIIDEVYRISYNSNPRIWIGIKWLATYVAFRPNELRNLRERDINVSGFFVVPSPKEKKPKLIAMLEEDIELYRQTVPRGLPDMFFFRHTKGNGGARPGSQFGKDYLYKWWKQACGDLGIEGVDLYGGTRHSTTTALAEHFTKDELRESGTMHATNQAFERYMQARKNDSLNVYKKSLEIRARILEIKKGRKN